MYDIVFISYQESNADENYAKLKDRFPLTKRVYSIKGIHQAHIAAAKKCFTKMFWAVDADAIVLDDFNFDYLVDDYNLETVHVWHSQNPINDLVYGYGGVKLLPRKLTIDMDITKPDMTTSISNHFKVINKISNITAFNTDEFSTWRSAFRECAKLASKTIDRQKSNETDTRLSVWCNNINKEQKFSKYAIQGALSGCKYGTANQNNNEALKMINDFDWLKEQFNLNC